VPIEEEEERRRYIKIHKINKICSYYKEKVKWFDTNNKKQIFLLSILYIYMKPDDGLMAETCSVLSTK
jgi:hypothetical protein